MQATPSGSSPSGSTCFDIPLIMMSGSVEVIENWITTSCTPLDDINRLVDYTCNTTPFCTGSMYADFPATTLIQSNPVPAVNITLEAPG